MVVDWKMSPVHPSSSIYRVLEEIKEIPAESWWNSYLPMSLSFPLGGSLSIVIAIEESKREWMFRCFMLVDWIRRKKIVFFYVREVNRVESLLICEMLHFWHLCINLWPTKNSAFPPYLLFREIVKDSAVNDVQNILQVNDSIRVCMECWKFGIKFSLIHDMDKIRRF